MRVRRATESGRLRATLRGLVDLRFEEAVEGVPHVRAASGVRRFAGGLAVVQDDAAYLAHVEGGRARAIPFEVGGDARFFSEALGNKRHKPDLEACLVVGSGADERFVAFGSGSTARRERLVVLDVLERARVVDARVLYALLRADTAFSGSELNLEGAVVVGDRVRLFQRANGAPRGELQPVNATADLALGAFVAWLDGNGELPRLTDVRQYELGEAGGVRYGFTDAATIDPHTVAYLASAEDSPDTYADGEVLGARVGLIGDGRIRDGSVDEASREGPFGDARDAIVDVAILDERGRPSRVKLEGLELSRVEDGAYFFHVVSDADDPELPAQLGELELRWDRGAPSPA